MKAFKTIFVWGIVAIIAYEAFLAYQRRSGALPTTLVPKPGSPGAALGSLPTTALGGLANLLPSIFGLGSSSTLGAVPAANWSGLTADNALNADGSLSNSGYAALGNSLPFNPDFGD